MFHGFGRNVCDVRFFEMGTDASGEPTRERIDRFEVLGKPRDWAANTVSGSDVLSKQR